MKTKESTKRTASALLVSLIVMSTIAVTASIIQSASASAVDDQKDLRCAPRSEFNGKENAGNEHNDASGNPDQVKNPHDEQLGKTKGNPHDRCVGS